MEDFKHFMVSLSAAAITAIVSITLVLTWVLYYREGLAWDGGAAEFNWHPVLMVSAFIFLNGVAIIVFRLPWTWKCSKLLMKFIHAALNVAAFISATVSFVAVFDFHNTAKIPNMYSLHSWLGLAALVLFGLQIIFGVILYLIPATPVSWKAAFMPIHIFAGRFLFGTAIAVALMGITEKLIFGLSNPKYKDSPPEATFVNILGVFLVAYGIAVLWISSQTSWKRPNDQLLHTLITSGGTEDNSRVGPSLSQLSNETGIEVCAEVRKRSNKSED